MKKSNLPDLSWTRWKPADIKRSAIGILDSKKVALGDIKKILAKSRTFENTILALERSDYELSDNLNKIDFLMYVSPDKNTRDTAQHVSTKIRQDLLPLEYDRDIWKAITEYKAIKEKLSGASKRLFDDYYKSYKRRGFDLPEKKFQKLIDNKKKLTELSTRFEKNINEYKDETLLEEKDLKGLPTTYVSTLRRKGKKFIVGLSYPEYFPFMEYAEDKTVRKVLSEKFFKRGGEKNLQIMKKILDLRFENAKLLGYKNYAEYGVELKMAKNPQNVEKFLNNLSKRIAIGARNDIKKLQEEKNRVLGRKEKLHHHDIAFYSRSLKERTMDLNKDEIKKHFPFEKVKDGVLDIYSTLLSVKFIRLEEVAWHNEVEMYRVSNIDGTVIGHFFMDMFPREGKYGHAAAFGIREGRLQDSGYIKPMSALVMNVPKPQKTQPSLLTHGEVETFFHEFGHVMHQILTRAPYLSQSGTSVAGDFVEAPSQILENWAWRKEVLEKITYHYQTGKRMSDEMINKIVKSKYFMEPYFVARQLVFAMFDLDIHQRNPKSINSVLNEHVRKLIGIEFPKGSIYAASFGHFVGYAAGYYGYMWSKVYAADMFTLFEMNGILNSKIGLKYRKEILEVGSSREEIDSVKAFLGRNSNSKAFFKSLGL